MGLKKRTRSRVQVLPHTIAARAFGTALILMVSVLFSIGEVAFQDVRVPSMGISPTLETKVATPFKRSGQHSTLSVQSALASTRHASTTTVSAHLSASTKIGASRLAEKGSRVVSSSGGVTRITAATGQSFVQASRALGDARMRRTLAGRAAADNRDMVAQTFSSRVLDELRRPADDAAETATSIDARFAALAASAPAKNVLEKEKKKSLLTLAYAPASTLTSDVFDHVLNEKERGFTPPIGPQDHSWAAKSLPAAAYSDREQKCLSNAIYFEARGEEEEGQAAVAQVILNRVRNPAYPKTICGVVYQNQSWKNRCQFSFACDGVEDRIDDRQAFAIAKRIAHKVTAGKTWVPTVGSATSYHATYVKPRWAKAMERVDKIGRHIFYRTFGGGWS